MVRSRFWRFDRHSIMAIAGVPVTAWKNGACALGRPPYSRCTTSWQERASMASGSVRCRNCCATISDSWTRGGRCRFSRSSRRTTENQTRGAPSLYDAMGAQFLKRPMTLRVRFAARGNSIMKTWGCCDTTMNEQEQYRYCAVLNCGGTDGDSRSGFSGRFIRDQDCVGAKASTLA